MWRVRITCQEIYYEGNATGETGLLLNGEAERKYFLPVQSTEMLLHDILEHTPTQSAGDPEDEIMALGAMQFLRGGNYTSPRSNVFYDYEYLTGLLAGVLAQFKDYLPEPIYEFSPSVGVAEDRSLRRISCMATERFLRTGRSSTSISKHQRFLEWVDRCFKKGYSLARERYIGSDRKFLAANFMEMVENPDFIHFVENQALDVGEEYQIEIDLETKRIQWRQL